MSESREPTGPYVLLSLMPELMTDDDEGYTHMPLAIESWPPGLDVERLLVGALAALRAEEGNDG